MIAELLYTFWYRFIEREWASNPNQNDILYCLELFQRETKVLHF